MTSEERIVVLFEETNPKADLNDQVKLGFMSHWQAKQYAEKHKGNGKEYFTVPKTEYDRLNTGKPKRHRRTKAEMIAARELDKVAS